MEAVRRLDAGQILAAQDLKREDVEVPEWGGVVTVQELSSGDREWFQDQAVQTTTTVGADGKPVITSSSHLEGLNGKLLCRCIVDENGKRLFDDKEAALLSEKSAAAVERLVEVALRLSKMGRHAIEVAAKNSNAAPSDAFSSDSPENSVAPSVSSSEASGAAS